MELYSCSYFDPPQCRPGVSTAFPIKMVLTFYRTLHKITSFIHVYNIHMFMKTVEKNINPSSALVQPRKTRPFITERLLMGRKESNQTKT